MKYSRNLLWMVCVLVMALLPWPVLAQDPGDLDPTFDGDGKLLTSFSSNSSDAARALVLQPDGKVVAAGTSSRTNDSSFALARYNADGSLDASFNGDGKLTTGFGQYARARALVLQPDNKILVAGSSNQANSAVADFALARYNPNGSLDTAFGGDGKVTTDFNSSHDEAFALILQPDGKLVVAGLSDRNFALARYNSNGSLDSAFDGDGKVTTDFNNNSLDTAYALALQTDDKIVVAGNGGNEDFALARYNPNGSLDTAFDGDGKLTTDFFGMAGTAQALALQPDGRIIAVGFTYALGQDQFALARYNPNGSLDPFFGFEGKVITQFSFGHSDIATAVALQPNSKIVVAGASDSGTTLFDMALVRYYFNGSLDPTFNGDGMLTTDFDNGSNDGAEALALQPDGKIIVAGFSGSEAESNFALARYFAPDPLLGSNRVFLPLVLK